MNFGVPMIWQEPTNHVNYCYFCNDITFIGWYFKEKKCAVEYPNIPSAIRPVPHGDGLPVPNPPQDY